MLICTYVRDRLQIMGKKRIIVEVHEDHFRFLVEEARAKGVTLANYVRQALDLPLERQGVKGTLSLPSKAEKAATKPPKKQKGA
jgi:hypothetical protein